MSKIIPAIKAEGFYELLAPLDTLIKQGEKYTCRAIRNISDYLANNEDIKTNVYDEYGLSAVIYDEHVNLNIEIISLQSELGHWVYVPVTYIARYPDVNGVIYRTVMIGVSLPSLPVDRDLSNIQTDIVNLVQDSLGVTVNTKIVETSKPVLVDQDTHAQLSADRVLASSTTLTDRSRLTKAQEDLSIALMKIAELELYIKGLI